MSRVHSIVYSEMIVADEASLSQTHQPENKMSAILFPKWHIEDFLLKLRQLSEDKDARLS